MIDLYRLARPAAMLTLVSTISITTGCRSSSNTGRNAASGITAGGIVGDNTTSKNEPLITNAVTSDLIGGSGGAIIRKYMEKLVGDIRKEISIVRVEPVNESIRLLFDADMLFSADSVTLNTTSQNQIRKLADILKRYADTDVVIEGHINDIGNKATDQLLSEQRVQTVTTFLKSCGVSVRRLTSIGYRDTVPVSTNETRATPQSERRLEVLIRANNELKRQACVGELRL